MPMCFKSTYNQASLYLIMLMFTCLFVNIDAIENNTNNDTQFCFQQQTYSFRRLFQHESCIYFSIVSLDDILYQYCLDSHLVNSNDTFDLISQGFVSRVESMVNIPIDCITTTNTNTSIQSIILIWEYRFGLKPTILMKDQQQQISSLDDININNSSHDQSLNKYIRKILYKLLESIQELKSTLKCINCSQSQHRMMIQTVTIDIITCKLYVLVYDKIFNFRLLEFDIGTGNSVLINKVLFVQRLDILIVNRDIDTEHNITTHSVKQLENVSFVLFVGSYLYVNINQKLYQALIHQQQILIDKRESYTIQQFFNCDQDGPLFETCEYNITCAERSNSSYSTIDIFNSSVSQIPGYFLYVIFGVGLILSLMVVLLIIAVCIYLYRREKETDNSTEQEWDDWNQSSSESITSETDYSNMSDIERFWIDMKKNGLKRKRKKPKDNKKHRSTSNTSTSTSRSHDYRQKLSMFNKSHLSSSTTSGNTSLLSFDSKKYTVQSDSYKSKPNVHFNRSYIISSVPNSPAGPIMSLSLNLSSDYRLCPNVPGGFVLRNKF